MKMKIELDAAEACAAAYDYLLKRGTLPAHGKVLSVKATDDRYGSASIVVETEVKEPEVVAPPATEVTP